MRVVLAPDKFKGCLPAAAVARALAAGLRAAGPGIEICERPVADGGDGTVAAALSAGFSAVPVTASGPTGEPVSATIAVRDGVAVIELADVVGLQRLPGGSPAPLRASTFGLGQAIAAALDLGAETIILGLGGSASTDGGAGMLQALGVRLTGQDGNQIGRGGGALGGMSAVDTSGLDARLASTRVLIASDVDNPLLGPAGAASVFGPQKGATAEQVQILEDGLATWAALTAAATGEDLASAPGAGAAGGTGFAALGYLAAAIRPGIDLVLGLVALDAALAGADLVVTGEGSLDRQTLGGKAPAGVARAAARHGVRVVAVAGRVTLSAAELASAGFAATYPLSSVEPDPAICLRDAARLLCQVGQLIATDLLAGPDEQPIATDLLAGRDPGGVLPARDDTARAAGP